MKNKMTKPKAKFKRVMKEFKEGKLHSGSKKGPKVSNPKQAVAIAYSEERRKASKDESHPKKHKDPKPKHKMMKPTLKKDGYEMHHGHEIQEMMEKHMYKGAGRRHHSEDSSKSAKHEPSGNKNKDETSKIKQHGYKIRPTEEVRNMMEEHMHAAANIKRHSSKGMLAAEGQDESYTGPQKPTRKNKVTDLNNGKKKLADVPYYEEAEEDSIKSYKRAGLGKNSGADNEKEDLEYAKKMKVGVKTKSNKKSKRK